MDPIAFLNALVQNHGYIGIFLAMFLSSATVIFPVPFYAAIPALASVLNPFWVGIAAGLGSAVGESTSYLVGVGGRKVASEKYGKEIKRIGKLFSKYRPFATILIFGVLPFPFDILGLFCGIVNYDFRKFLLATSIAKTARFWILAYFGSFVADFLLPFGGWPAVLAAVIIIAIITFAVWRHFEG